MKNNKLLTKMAETKVLRDPVHKYIHMNYQILWDAMNSREFQRLRRIRQLGGDVMVYHTGDHSRFAHSLGVYEIFRRMAEEVPSIRESLSEKEKVLGMLAALLHDIGHGPYSHFFESLAGWNHEQIGARILLEESSEIHKILVGYDPGLPETIVSILDHSYENKLLSSMISSQLDADRMDYLLRDAYFTGTQYGSFDLERILRILRVKDKKLCIKQSGVRSVEDYILARSQMYWQVYLHPDSFGYELLITQFFRRYEDVRKDDPIQVFEPLYIDSSISLEDFFWMDECSFQYGFSVAARSDDAILRDLADRIINRRLFAWKENPDKQEIQNIQKSLSASNFDLKYYYYLRKPVLNQVLPYQEEADPILVLKEDGSLEILSKVSEIARVLLSVRDQAPSRLYIPKIQR